jgi:hypothetical protein
MLLKVLGYRQVPRKPRLAGGDESAQSKNNQIWLFGILQLKFQKLM